MRLWGEQQTAKRRSCSQGGGVISVCSLTAGRCWWKEPHCCDWSFITETPTDLSTLGPRQSQTWARSHDGPKSRSSSAIKPKCKAEPMKWTYFLCLYVCTASRQRRISSHTETKVKQPQHTTHELITCQLTYRYKLYHTDFSGAHKDSDYHSAVSVNR